MLTIFEIVAVMFFWVLLAWMVRSVMTRSARGRVRDEHVEAAHLMGAREIKWMELHLLDTPISEWDVPMPEFARSSGSAATFVSPNYSGHREDNDLALCGFRFDDSFEGPDNDNALSCAACITLDESLDWCPRHQRTCQHLNRNQPAQGE